MSLINNLLEINNTQISDVNLYNEHIKIGSNLCNLETGLKINADNKVLWVFENIGLYLVLDHNEYREDGPDTCCCSIHSMKNGKFIGSASYLENANSFYERVYVYNSIGITFIKQHYYYSSGYLQPICFITKTGELISDVRSVSYNSILGTNSNLKSGLKTVENNTVITIEKNIWDFIEIVQQGNRIQAHLRNKGWLGERKTIDLGMIKTSSTQQPVETASHNNNNLICKSANIGIKSVNEKSFEHKYLIDLNTEEKLFGPYYNITINEDFGIGICDNSTFFDLYGRKEITELKNSGLLFNKNFLVIQKYDPGTKRVINWIRVSAEYVMKQKSDMDELLAERKSTGFTELETKVISSQIELLSVAEQLLESRKLKLTEQQIETKERERYANAAQSAKQTQENNYSEIVNKWKSINK